MVSHEPRSGADRTAPHAYACAFPFWLIVIGGWARLQTAARVSAVTMSDAMLIDIWRVRIFIAAAGLVASVAWWRRNIRQP